MPSELPSPAHSLSVLSARYSRLESVYRLTRRIASAASEAEISSVAIETLLEVAPDRRASLLLFDADSIMRFRAWHGLSDTYRAAVEGHSPWRPTDLDAKPIVVSDVTLDSSLEPYWPGFAAEGIRSLAFVPLVGRTALLGKFMLYGDSPGDPLAGDADLVQNIADHVAIVVERTRTEHELRRDRSMFAAGPIILFRWRMESGWPVDYVSPNVAQFGYAADDFVQRRILFANLIHPDDLQRVAAEVRAHTAAGELSFEQRYRIRTAAGEWRDLFDHTTIGRDGEGRVCFYDGYVLDITDQRRLEQELLQAQKMESIGRLAGGVAHDFNNLLTVIMGAAEHASTQAQPGSELSRAVDSISQAAHRAASLTAQLLAFARKQVIAPRVVDLNQLLGSVSDLLRRALGEQVELVIETQEASPYVRVDPGQMQQILMNLALNARDAMPNGGRLTLRTGSESTAPHARPTQDVELSVSDTGHGMSAATQEHLFEPFFTTKETGRGTGLGLATCYGIVQQSGGRISVRSELGKGTCFTIQLPRAGSNDLPLVASAVPGPQALGIPGATLLLAEDDALVRDFMLTALTRGGFEVLAASNGPEALARAAAHAGVIDLLVSDLVMPQMGGRELADQLRRARPAVRVLYCTGYDFNRAHEAGKGEPGDALLSKPFTAAQLIAVVRRMLSESLAIPASRPGHE